MGALRLIRLAVVGDGQPDSAVEFGPGLTVIYGSSNTGKSYVVEALDYMLGAKALKAIPESEPYRYVMLSMTLPDDTPLTLLRKKDGGQFLAYKAHLTSLPDPPPDFTLAPSRGSTTKISLSRFLLQTIGLDGKEVRKNAQNVTVPLSFRNLCLLCLVDETKVQAKAAPATSGQHVTATAELSVFKLLVQGEDDSEVAQEAGAAEKRKVSKGKAEILDQAIAELRQSVEGQARAAELGQQLSRIVRSIEGHAASIDVVLAVRNEVVARQAEIVRRSSVYQTRLADVTELVSRFALLQSKYDSDLARLEMVREAGTLLGFFRPGVCVFCGATVEHQAAEAHSVEEITTFGESVLAEIQKTTGLRDDLDATIADLQSQDARLNQGISRFLADATRLQAEIGSLDARLQPERTAMQDLLSARSAMEAGLAAYAQMERLEALKATVEPGPEDTPAAAPGVAERVLDEFSASIREVLHEWAVPISGNVRYSKTANDLLIDDQPRSSHGKGMRAILHAAFTAGLAQYCFNRDLEHPGFIVLDSPLVTYREPEPGVADAPSSEEFNGVANSFYSYFDTRFDGQSIIVENTDPPPTLSEEAVLIQFTGSAGAGRYGFFPSPNRIGQTQLPLN